jgi:amino acid adenylation domain-containing protein
MQMNLALFGDTARAAAVPSVLRASRSFVPFDECDIPQALSSRFEEQVRRHPDRLAVSAGEIKLSYAELNRRANRLARAVIARGGCESEPVLLLLDKGAPLIAAMLAVLKAGKFYVPLSPSYPPARNALIAEDSGATLIVADARNVATARQLAGAGAVILIEEVPADLGDADLDVYPEPHDYAYIIYTSGSTGRPKGVLDTHRNVLHNMRRYTNSHYLSAEDRMLCLSSCASSACIKEIYGPLLNGGALFLVDLEREGLAQLPGLMARDGITVCHAVVTVFRNLVSALREGDYFPQLRVMRLGSEAVTRRDVELFRQHFPRGCVLVNGYGATETGTTLANYLDHDTAITDSTVPIGYPVDGIDVLLLDEAGEPICEPGRIGQIAARSEYMSPGYWRRPDATDAVFRPGPAGSGRMYLTGDMGFFKPNGCLVYAGRKDFQVKIRGNRVEVADIELALVESPSVKEAVVIKRDDQPEDRSLVAYLVPRDPDRHPMVPELRGWLKGRFPEYAMPASFVILDGLPVTPTGKVDRKALPAPTADRPDVGCACVPARNAIEAQLVELWEELLRVRPIGVHDNFFDLGGSSLVAAQLFVKIGRMFRKDLPLSTLIHSGTIDALARLIGADDKPLPAQRHRCLVPIQPRGSRPAFYCVHGIGGEVVSLERLAKLLGPDQPFYGFQARALSNEAPHRTIEEMATAYVEELVHFQPVGPYFIGGYSCGAAVAYEMAQQLRKMGREVGLLVLIDQRRPNLDPTIAWTPSALVRVLANVPGWLAYDLLHSRPAEILSRVRVKAGMVGRAIKARLRRAAAVAEVADMFEMARIPENYRTLLQINFRALRAYVPRPYPGKVAMFIARAQPLLRWHEPLMGWKGLLTGDTEYHALPGAHSNFVGEPYVHLLAHTLAGSLERAAQRACCEVAA